ncbi:tyrosine-type recombinase/integrase [Thiomicrorhabdus indica]|uniref:tyrosine-type recombinase/integrase n=1 Tax=Thiomicrorhabdus indica TaxID=2267253 RepID=UPI00197F496B|nr:site-specific integrase [Thiomicrorhabdus indica]
MVSLLNKCAGLLSEGKKAAEAYKWQKIRFAEVSMLKASLLEQGYAVSSVNLALSAMKGLARTAFNMYLLDAEDLERIRAIKRVRGDAVREKRSLSKDEIQQLIAATQEASFKTQQYRDKALVYVAVCGGLRVSEITALSVSDFNAQTGSLMVRQGKGRKNREVLLPPKAIRALNSWIQLLPLNDIIFTRISKSGSVLSTGLSSAGVASILKMLQRNAEVASFSPHDLRRTFITQLLEHNVDLNTVRQMAGHSDISTTIQYDYRDMHSQKSVAANCLNF